MLFAAVLLLCRGDVDKNLFCVVVYGKVPEVFIAMFWLCCRWRKYFRRVKHLFQPAKCFLPGHFSILKDVEVVMIECLQTIMTYKPVLKRRC